MEKIRTFKEAEAVGQIKTMPETFDIIQDKGPEQSHEFIDTPDKFQQAVGNAQLDGLDFIEVEEKLFKHLIKNSKTEYLTYGKPGVKVFLRGTRDQILKKDGLNAEMYHELVTKKAMENNPK